MMTKHEIKKSEIIKCAFSEWGKLGFHTTSLSPIAEKMKLSKTAFYRYFKSKDDLFESMVEYFLNDYIKISKSAIENYENSGLQQFILNYIKIHFTFFAENQHYLHFFALCAMKNNFSKYSGFIEIQSNEKKAFKEVFSKTKTIVPQEKIGTYIRFVYATGIFVLFYNISQKCSKNKKEIIECTETEISDYIKMIFDISTKGFGTENIKNSIDFEKIEKESFIQKEEIPERDKIFNAITGVVAKEGIFNASIDKIAKEAGMSKSNLYFYFKNKEDMFENMLVKEVTTLNELFQSRSRNYSSIEELIYCNIIVSYSSLFQDRRIVYFFNWLHIQRIDLKNLKKNKKMEESFRKRFGFIKEAIENKKLNSYGFNMETLASFLNMHIVKEILLALPANSSDYTKEMRIIDRLFLTGIFERS
jgi:AcrR family transcriptional regulator